MYVCTGLIVRERLTMWLNYGKSFPGQCIGSGDRNRLGTKQPSWESVWHHFDCTNLENCFNLAGCFSHTWLIWWFEILNEMTLKQICSKLLARWDLFVHPNNNSMSNNSQFSQEIIGHVRWPCLMRWRIQQKETENLLYTKTFLVHLQNERYC